MAKKINLPYFDHVLKKFSEKDSELSEAFSKNIHWGYWENPHKNKVAAKEYADAQEALVEQLVKLAEPSNESVIADIACGFGGTIDFLNKNSANKTIVGLNIDIRQLIHAKNHINPDNRNNIFYVTGDAVKLPFASASVDILFTVEAIFHFSDREAYFKEVNRVLKPEGKFIISDFISAENFKLGKYLIWKNQRASYFGDFDLRYTISKYKKISAKTGFEVSHIMDVTKNTLPTFTYLNAAGKEMTGNNLFSRFQIKFLEYISMKNLLRYYLLKFKKTTS